jgi:NADPH2:quinone reductase
MKAIICDELGTPDKLKLKNISAPNPGKHEVVIDVKACSVNFPDSLIIQGLYQFKPPLPFTPGSDVAGVVTAVGENVSQYKIGDRIFGTVMTGGFAEKVAVNVAMSAPIPPALSDAVAASFMMAYGTSYHALKQRARLAEGETVLVLGAAGGVGLAAVEIAKAMGATVIAAASSAEKLDLCQRKGADHLINYTTENLRDRIKEITNGRGIDVCYDPVGGEYTEQVLRSMAWGGRLLIVGFPAGIAQIPMNLPLLKGCDIVGVFWGSHVGKEPRLHQQNVMELLQLLKEGKINPHIDKEYSLEQTPQAIQDMMDRKVKGKIVVIP